MIRRDYATPPRETIAELIVEYATDGKILLMTDDQRLVIKGIVDGLDDITADSAQVLFAVFNVPVEFWLKLEQNWQTYLNPPSLGLHYKNWLAFRILIDNVIYDLGKMPSPEYFKEKFVRYVLSERADEYKWGIHPILLRQFYRYLDEHDVELDQEEKLAKKSMTEADMYNAGYDRRWPVERTKEL